MLHNALTSIICNTFETQCGRCQNKNVARNAFLVNFRMYGTYISKHEEKSHRTVQLAIYAPMNYVGVAYREGKFMLNGFAQQGDITPWKKISYHDSCWRGVECFIYDERDQIAYIDDFNTKNWFTIEPATDELVACIAGVRY